jgi:hypothetical protein
MDIIDKLSGPPTKDQFAQLMMDAIRKAGETGEITYEQEEFRLRGEGENGSIIFLSNAHQEYCSAPAEQRETILKRSNSSWIQHRGAPVVRWLGIASPEWLQARREWEMAVRTGRR